MNNGVTSNLLLPATEILNLKTLNLECNNNYIKMKKRKIRLKERMSENIYIIRWLEK